MRSIVLSSLDLNMHAEPIWLPTTAKKTVVATDDRLCNGDFDKCVLCNPSSALYFPRLLPVIISHYDSLLMCQVT